MASDISGFNKTEFNVSDDDPTDEQLASTRASINRLVNDNLQNETGTWMRIKLFAVKRLNFKKR